MTRVSIRLGQRAVSGVVSEGDRPLKGGFRDTAQFLPPASYSSP